MSARARYGRAVAARVMICGGLLLSASIFAAADDALPKPIAELLAQHRIPRAALSLEVTEMERAMGAAERAPLLSINAHVPRNPASVIKLLTTLAALELLGPHYLWQTAYLTDGMIVDGALHGDLILRGGGDPFLSVERLLEHVLALRQHGLRDIKGRLVIDNSHFAPQVHDRGAFDGKAQRLYNVGADAALTNFSATNFVLTPHGKQIRVTAEPPLAGLQIVNRLVAGGGRCLNRNAGWSYRIIHAGDNLAGDNLTVNFDGVYRRRCGAHSIARSLLPNPEYTHRLFTALWRAMGGNLALGNRVATTPASAQLLLTRDSEPLADIITGINKFSNNVMSRQLLLTIGAESDRQIGTVEAGAAAIKKWLSAKRIGMPGLVLANGSGLSRKTRATASGLSALLAHGWRSTYSPEFVSSLSLAALDGTMRSRLSDSPLRGRARLKTGLINGVRSMAGYVHARSGRYYNVVMILDSRAVNLWNGNEMQDAVLRWVYQQ